MNYGKVDKITAQLSKIDIYVAMTSLRNQTPTIKPLNNLKKAG